MRNISQCTNKTTMLAVLGLVFCISIAVSARVQAEDKDKEVDVIYSKLLQALPEDSTLVAVPYADALNAYGQKANGMVNEQSTMLGGKSYEVDVKKSKNPYDAGITLAVNPAVKKGEIFHLTFFAKALKLPKGKQSIRLPGIGIQLNKAPYDHIFMNSAEITSNLGSFSYAGRADRDYSDGQLQVSFQIASDTQSIAFGPVFVFKIGAENEIKSLPFIN